MLDLIRWRTNSLPRSFQGTPGRQPKHPRREQRWGDEELAAQRLDPGHWPGGWPWATDPVHFHSRFSAALWPLVAGRSPPD